MKITKALKAVILTVILSTTTVLAQQQMMPPQIAPADSVSDGELKDFVEVAMEMQDIRMEMDSLVIARLEVEGMSTQRFQEIMMAKSNPDATQNSSITAEEEKVISGMQSFLQEVSMKAQKQQLEAIQQSELGQQRFQSIARALQTDQQLAMRFQQMAMEMEAAADNE